MVINQTVMRSEALSTGHKTYTALIGRPNVNLCEWLSLDVWSWGAGLEVAVSTLPCRVSIINADLAPDNFQGTTSLR